MSLNKDYIDIEIKKTLKGILSYVEADMKYVDYAELQGDLEKLIRRCGGDID